MLNGSLLSILRSLECLLHDPGVRRDRERLVTLLHPEYREFGRSGVQYSRAQIIDHLLSETNAAKVHAQGFAIVELAPLVVLLTYKSAYISSSGVLERHANRSSIWRREIVGWQMVFHQGTPTEPFEAEYESR
jgi:hypothetical protein